MTWDIETQNVYHDGYICHACGDRWDNHRCLDGKCPPQGKRFPKWPVSIRDEKRAGAVFDKRIDSYWRKTKTTFKGAMT